MPVSILIALRRLFLSLLFLILLIGTAQAIPRTAAGIGPLPSIPTAQESSPVSGPDARGHGARPQVVPTPPAIVPPTMDADELAAAIPSPPNPAAWIRQTVSVAVCTSPPQIDGRINDACWRTATRASGFFRLGGTAPIDPANQTEGWICADKTHLYIAFHCLDSHPELIHANQVQRNGNITEDDYVGVDIDSQNSRRSLSTFDVTPRGTQEEYLEGGTADNITWAGDWKAAAVRTKDGWTAEISIPFALLRYPRGTKAFGLNLFRKLAREPSLENWPYLPPDGYNNEPAYIHEFTGFQPPFFAPRPIFLPYTLLTGGTGSAGKFGLDVKYPLSTTLTGVATLFPDFQTIEQDVTNINFSYTEKLLTDRRPFFAEGAGFLPYQDLFYSRRIGAVDGGVKVAGKQGDTSIGFLATDTSGTQSQNTAVLALNHDLGLFSRAAVNFVSDIQTGQPSNQVGKLEGVYGWRVGQDRWAVQLDHVPSWQRGRPADSEDYYRFSTTAVAGHPSFAVDHTDLGPNFVSNLGYLPDLDEKGSTVVIEQANTFDRSRLRVYDVALSANSFQHHTGGFFQNDLNGNIYLESRGGVSYDLNLDQSRRDEFHDHTVSGQLGWGRRTLFQRGSLGDTFGRQAGQSYNYLTFSQGILISRPFSVEVDYNHLRFGDSTATQTILTGNYLLSSERSLGLRIVNQAGDDQGTGLGTNLYFSFAQHVRAGSDLFLLFGDPNSPRTRGKVTLKIIKPF